MATIKAVLNKDRKKKNGEYPLVMQILHKRLKRVIYTPYQLRPDEFDSARQSALYTDGVLYSRKQIKELNIFTDTKKQELEKVIKYLTECGKDFTTEDIVLRYRLAQSEKYLITFMEGCIAQKQTQGKAGIARAYSSTLRSLNKYIGKRMVAFVDIDHNFVKGYETFLDNSKVKQNTISFYLRNFRTIYNLAYDNGIDVGEGNAFRKIKIKSVKTIKRALKQEVIEQIALMDLTESPELDKARDLFMFSFYTRGMSFVDIVFLKHTDIVEGVIYYRRRKTDQLIEVALTTPLKVLIDKYATDTEFVLPFINLSNRTSLYERYQLVYGVFYRCLNHLQVKLGLATPLTTYVARHSWATIAKEIGASTSIISESLGHTSEKTTQIYLKGFDRSVIDMVNEQIVSFSTVQYVTNQKNELPL